MKLFLAASLVASASAFAPAFAPRQTVTLDASITETLETLQGPEQFWGAEGVLVGKDEADIKGYDNFGQLAAAINDADILKYHVIPGKKSLDALTVDQETLNGGTLTSYRKFRKNWLDNAIVGLKSEGPSKSSSWPSDVACDNGVI